MTFGRSERVAFKEFIAPTFARFLKKCYCKLSHLTSWCHLLCICSISAVQECRERALPEHSEFAGLAGAEGYERVEVHTIEDNRSMEESNYVRTAPPRPNPSTALKSNPGTVSADRWVTKSSTKTSLTLPPIKFGPPRNGTKPAGAEPPANKPITVSASHAVVEKLIGDPLGDSGAQSRGPTPPVSRAQTPQAAAISLEFANPKAPTDLAASDVAPMEVCGGGNVEPMCSVAPPPSSPAPAELPAPPLATAESVEQVAGTLLPPNVYHGASAVAAQLASPPARSSTPSQLAADSIAHKAIPPGQDAAIAQPQAGGMSSTASNAPSNSISAPPSPDSAALTAPHPKAHAEIPTATRSSTRTRHPPPRLAAVPSQPKPRTTTFLPGSTAVPDMQVLEAEESEKRARKRKGRAPSTGPRSKKRRANSKLPSDSASSSRTVSAASLQGSSATLIEDPDTPDWATASLQRFRSIALGSEWDALLSNWIKFELELGFEGRTRLGAKYRPRVITDWIQWGRSPTFRAEIKNIASFSTEFNTWWTSLQPDWRSNGPNAVLLRDGEDWECLRRPGINGLLSVIAGLFFWGCAVQKLHNTNVAWLEAVDDVSYSITQLL